MLYTAFTDRPQRQTFKDRPLSLFSFLVFLSLSLLSCLVFLLCCVLAWLWWWVAPWAILAHRRNLNWNLNWELSPTWPPHMGDAAEGNAKAQPCCCRHQSWCWPRLAKCHRAEAQELWQQFYANVVHHTTQVKAWDGLPKVLPLQVLEPNLLEPEFELPYLLDQASARALPLWQNSFRNFTHQLFSTSNLFVPLHTTHRANTSCFLPAHMQTTDSASSWQHTNCLPACMNPQFHRDDIRHTHTYIHKDTCKHTPIYQNITPSKLATKSIFLKNHPEPKTRNHEGHNVLYVRRIVVSYNNRFMNIYCS